MSGRAYVFQDTNDKTCSGGDVGDRSICLDWIPGARANALSLVIQAALTLILLAGAGVMARSFARLLSIDLGYDPTDVVMAQVDLPRLRYGSPAQRVVFIESALEQLRALPGVSAAALASAAPLRGGVMGSVSVPEVSPHALPHTWSIGVTPEYFRALGILLLQGNELSGASAAGLHGVVIDEAVVREYFPDGSPLGRQLVLLDSMTGTVIGVAGGTRMFLTEAPFRHVYYPLVSRPGNRVFVVVRASGHTASLEGPLREAIQRVDPALPVDRVATMDELMSDWHARQRSYGLLLAGFAGFALLLAAAGMFGSVSYAVAQRTRELGVRIALGAEGRDVVSLMVGRAMRVALVGAVLGVMGALATNRLLRSLLHEVEPTDPLVLSAVSALLLAVFALASYLPARRAANVDPMVVLRAE